MFTADEIAKYIINFCIKKEFFVTNLKLLRLLYFVWRDYYRDTKKFLFHDFFYAWKLGLVVTTVYKEYCRFAGLPITEKQELPQESSYAFLDKILERYYKKSLYELTEETQKESKAWQTVWDNGRGNKEIILFSVIIELDV